MKRSTRRFIAIALSVTMLCNSTPVLAVGSKANYVAPMSAARANDRLIVKFKANSLPRGLSVAQIRERLTQPLTAQTVSQLQAAAGVALTELHAISGGAHVLSVAGRPNQQALNNAIAGIGRLASIEYVEEDVIMTAQAAPNDTYYTTDVGGNPGLWGLQAASAVAAPAPGGTGSYGADFEAAWNTVTGTGVVVAVVDTGITPHVDIVGAGGTVSPATGNLVSPGYDFITDCRMRGSCAATTPNGSEYVAPSANATDLGDFFSSADCNTAGSVFFGCAPSNSSWHGTHVSGTIAAIGNNAAGVIGGAYNAKILPVRVLGKGGGTLSDIAEGIRWAAGVHATIANSNPAKVINMSLGGGGSCGPTMQNAINAAVGAGTVVVVAAGNSNADVANFQPASCQNVITVAATGRDGSRATYSNYSSPASNTTNPTNVTLAAQGGDQWYPASFDPGILSTLNASSGVPDTTPAGSTYVDYQGTSMATPHVAAAAALMLATNPALTPAQIKTIVSAPASQTAFPSFTGSGIVPPAWDCVASNNCGAGILNANLAVQNSVPTALTAAATADLGSVLVNSTINQNVTLTNSSQVSVRGGTVTVTGGDAGLFTVGTNTCSGANISPSGTCQVTVSYAPVAAGAHTTSLSVTTTGAAAPTLVSLNGSAGSLALTTTTPDVAAATVTVGQSTTVDVSYTNPNGTTLRAGAISLSNPTTMAASADACSNQTLNAGASCTVTVTVTPTAAGSYSGTASLALSGGGTAALATITGSANPGPAPAPAPAQSSGGGGCSIMPFGADPDASLLLAMLAVAAYWLRRRIVRERSAA